MRRVTLNKLLQRVPTGEREQKYIKVKRASELCTEVIIKAASGSPVIVIEYTVFKCALDETYIVKYR